MSSHLFAEASAHMLAVTPTAHWLEVLDLGRAILAEYPGRYLLESVATDWAAPRLVRWYAVA